MTSSQTTIGSTGPPRAERTVHRYGGPRDSSSGSQRLAHVLINVLVLASSIALILFQPVDALDEMLSIVWPLLGLQLYSHYRYTLQSTALHPLLSLDVLFITAVTALSWAGPILVTVGLAYPDLRYLETLYGDPVFARAQPVALLAVAAVCSGVMLGRRGASPGRRATAPTRIRPGPPGYDLATALAIPGSVLLLYFIVFAGAYYLSGSYGDVHSVGEIYDTPFLFSQLLLTLAVSLLASGSRVPPPPIWLIVLVPYVTLLTLLGLHGDRGRLVLCAAPILYLGLRSVTADRRRWLIVPTGVLVLLVGFTTFGVIRETRDADQRGLSSFVRTVSDLSLQETLVGSAMTIGGSGILLSSAIRHRDEVGSTGGRFALVGALGAIPYSRRTLIAVGLLPADDFMTSSELLTYRTLGAGATSGVGTTTISDLYLDFGWLGVLVGHALVGWVAARIQRGVSGPVPDDRRLMLYIFSIGVFATMARYSAVTILVRYVLYGYVLILLFDFLTRETRRIFAKAT